ncbi:MAG TPA: hypothetical protein VN641_11240 [Urbifossiella sp.]|nr:hypothetical protein [Urbifossiella sp.]
MGKLDYIRDPGVDLHWLGGGVDGGGRMYDPTTVRWIRSIDGRDREPSKIIEPQMIDRATVVLLAQPLKFGMKA